MTDKKKLSVADEYKERTADIFDDLGRYLEEQFKLIENPNDYYKSLMGLNYIIQQNIYSILSDFNAKYKVYQTAGSVRFVFECVADAAHLQKHATESTDYYSAQRKIQIDLKAAKTHAEKWEVFKKGNINFYGQLSERKTGNRVENAYGDDGVGAYGFLCFFTHPNIASAFWHKADEEHGFINLYLIEILNEAVLKWIMILTESAPFEFDGPRWAESLAEVYADTLAKIKPEKKK